MNNQAPEGKKWFCLMCGKTSPTLSGEVGGWDESCALNAILIDQLSTGPSREQVVEFGKERDAAFARGLASMDALIEQIRNRTPVSAELLALADPLHRMQAIDDQIGERDETA